MRTPLLPSRSVAEPSDRRVRALVCPPQGVLDVSERMLDSLPEWRMKLGRRVMNEVTRLVVVSWGRASQEKKEAAAEKLGLDKGA